MGVDEEVARPGLGPASVEVASVALHEEAVEPPPYVVVQEGRSERSSSPLHLKGRRAEAEITVTDYAADRWSTGETRYKNGGMGDPPCTDCHLNGQAVDHSPSALATSSDEKIGAIITTGISPAGFPIQIDGQPGHQWKVSDVERAGLVTYLRSLEPRDFKER